jgi:hypothetical protein
MRRLLVSKVLLTIVLGGGSIMSFVLDWSSNHLLSPLWHPHARFHAAILLFLFAGVAATALWLIWRRSLEPKIALTAAALLSASYWMPFFFVPFLLPGSSWWAGTPGHEPRIGGTIFYPNLAVVGLFLALTVAAWWLGVSVLTRYTPTRSS